jgi:hypothetical protein
MAINQNHLFEELDGVKCAIVEKNVLPARVEFLRRLLEANRYTVIVVPSPPAKAVPAAPAPKPAAAAGPTPASPAPEPTAAAPAAASAPPAEGAPATAASAPAPAAETPPPPAPPPYPETLTIGVTDVAFNPINAIFGRLLKTPDRRIVTLAYWQQKDAESHDETPYFDNI